MFEIDKCDFVSMEKAKLQEKALPIHEVIRLTSRSLAAADNLNNREITALAGSYRDWTPGDTYLKGDIVTDPFDKRQYILAQSVVASEQYPPHGEGVLAIYRPVPKENQDGTFMFIYGQNVFAGDRCYDGTYTLWKAKKDMLPCTWHPQDGNEWERIG